MRAAGEKCLQCALRLRRPAAFPETPWSKSTLLRISNYRDPGHMTRKILVQTMIALALAAGANAFAQQAEPAYDLLLRGGHVLDDKNHIDGVMDEAIKDRIIDRSKTRVFAMLNIVGAGMRGGHYEQNMDDMDGEATAAMALKYPNTIVGIKTAHFAGPEWKPVEQAVIAGTKANIPVMVDFGVDHPERPLYDLLTKKLRPGDIYTHMCSGLRHEQDPDTLGPSKGFIEGRKRGVYFDVGQGGGSFKWSLAVPMIKDGFIPDSISTDLHITSMNGAMKDELNVADKILALGVPLKQVVAEMTSHPAHEIKHEELGNLSEGSIADVTVLRVENGNFGFTDMVNRRFDGKQKLLCELTIKDGRIVYDLNGISADLWTAKPDPHAAEARKWTTFAPSHEH